MQLLHRTTSFREREDRRCRGWGGVGDCERKEVPRPRQTAQRQHGGVTLCGCGHGQHFVDPTPMMPFKCI